MHAEIHHYDGTGVTLDDDGDPLFGFYYQILNDLDLPLSMLMGPYATGHEAETACQHEFTTGSYQ